MEAGGQCVKGAGVSAGGAPSLRGLVEDALAQVPRGKVTTYGDIARALGDVRAARAVAHVLATNAHPQTVACHRVIMKDGALGGYAFGGPAAKAALLAQEGVQIRGDRVQRLETVVVQNLQLTPLFAQLAQRQSLLAAKVRLRDGEPAPRIAIGVDASYAPGDDKAWAAACAFQIGTGKPIDSVVVDFVPPIPYVPGYLAFRELPGIVAAVKALPPESRKGAVVLVDGQGILHPRRCGIASMMALEVGLPAVGVAKSKLVGTPVGSPRGLRGATIRDLSVEGETRGALVRAEGTARDLVVSPGSGISLRQCVALIARMASGQPKGPAPLLAADGESRRARSDASG